MLAIVGCTLPPTHQPAPPRPSVDTPTPAAPTADTAVPPLLLQAGDSRIELRLDRDGPLALLGHRHVIVTRAVHGMASFDPANPKSATFTATFRVDSLQVDDPAERTAAGAEFATLPDAAAIAGTRKNMLSAALLDAERFPELGIRLQELRPVAVLDAGFLANVVFTVKGGEYALAAPVRVTPLPEGGYAATGEWTITHAELGLTPYSAAGGLIKVADAIDVRFRLVARPE